MIKCSISYYLQALVNQEKLAYSDFRWCSKGGLVVFWVFLPNKRIDSHVFFFGLELFPQFPLTR